MGLRNLIIIMLHITTKQGFDETANLTDIKLKIVLIHYSRRDTIYCKSAVKEGKTLRVQFKKLV